MIKSKLKFDIENSNPPSMASIDDEKKRLIGIMITTGSIAFVAAIVVICSLPETLGGFYSLAMIIITVSSAALALVFEKKPGALPSHTDETFTLCLFSIIPIVGLGVLAKVAGISPAIAILAGFAGAAAGAMNNIYNAKRALRDIDIHDTEAIEKLETARSSGYAIIDGYLALLKEQGRLPVISEITALDSWVNRSVSRNQEVIDSLKSGSN